MLPELASKGVRNVWAWGSLAHLPEVKAAIPELASFTPSRGNIAAVRAGTNIGLDAVGPESDGIIFFTSG